MLAQHCELHCGKCSISLVAFEGVMVGGSDEMFIAALKTTASRSSVLLHYAMRARLARAYLDARVDHQQDGYLNSNPWHSKILLFGIFEMEASLPSDKI